jgi:DNA-binding response OmpR family regulator
LEILLVVDNETVADTLSATLQRSGHQVTASTTIAGTIEVLMRRGPFLDVIIMSTQFGSALGEDAIQYGRKFATHAQVIVLQRTPGDVEDVELALSQQALPARLQAVRSWN